MGILDHSELDSHHEALLIREFSTGSSAFNSLGNGRDLTLQQMLDADPYDPRLVVLSQTVEKGRQQVEGTGTLDACQ